MTSVRKKNVLLSCVAVLVIICYVTGKSDSPFRFAFFPIIFISASIVDARHLVIAGVFYSTIFGLSAAIYPPDTFNAASVIVEISALMMSCYVAGKTAKGLNEERSRSENAFATFQSISNEMKYKTMNLQTTLEALSNAHNRLKEFDQEKTRFFATVSHELRTPLSSVRAYSEILLSYHDIDNETRQEFIKIINLESERLTGMINEILDLSKIEAGMMTLDIRPVEQSKLVNGSIMVLAPMAAEKGIPIIAELPEDAPPVSGDLGQLTQVLINLINNAIKFTNKGQITVGTRILGEMCEFYIKDTGEGIYPNEQKAIFEEFYRIADSVQGRPHGSGLGLCISKRIVEYHGGQIKVESAPGEGSTFSFTIPLSKVPSTVESTGEHNYSTVIPSACGSTLVLSESVTIRQALRKKLEELGYRTLGAGSPAHALLLCNENKPDLIITDVADEWDEFLKLDAWAKSSGVRIILSTLLLNPPTGELSLALNGYLCKPFDWFAILGSIEKISKPGARLVIISPDNVEARELQAILASKGFSADLFADAKDALKPNGQPLPYGIIIGSFNRTKAEELIIRIRCTTATENIPLFQVLQTTCSQNVTSIAIGKADDKKDRTGLYPLIKEVEHTYSIMWGKV